MTLDTRIRTTGTATVSHRDMFNFAVQALVKAAGREYYAASIKTRRSEVFNEPVEWSTVIGQGLPGIVTVAHKYDHYEISYDTAYGYNENGLNCTELHVSAMLHLEQILPEWCSIIEWQNEYTGDWHEARSGQIGLGVVEFLGHGNDALDWFADTSSRIMFGGN